MWQLFSDYFFLLSLCLTKWQSISSSITIALLFIFSLASASTVVAHLFDPEKGKEILSKLTVFYLLLWCTPEVSFSNVLKILSFPQKKSSTNNPVKMKNRIYRPVHSNETSTKWTYLIIPFYYYLKNADGQLIDRIYNFNIKMKLNLSFLRLTKLGSEKCFRMLYLLLECMFIIRLFLSI